MKTFVDQIRKISIALIAVFMSLSILDITPLKAKTPTVEVKNEYPMSAVVKSADGYHETWWSVMGYIYIDGEIAFCIEPEQFTSTGASYTASEFSFSQRQLLERIAYVGWELSDKTDEDYTATQFMIWETLGNTIESTSFSDYSAKKKEIQNKIDKLFYSYPSFRNQTVELDVGESITLTDTNGVFSNYYLDSKSTGLTVSKSGNKLTITATKNAPENAKVSYNLIKDGYVGTSMKFYSPTSQDVVVFKIEDPRSFNINVKVNKYGSLKITKQDEDGTLVPNTSFKVSANSDMSDPIGTYTTGSDGTVTIEDLTPATYYVQEVSVPNHLVLDSTIHQVTVQSNQTATFTAQNNWKKGKVLIRKTDKDSSKQVAGAVYAIFNANTDQEVARLTTLANGYASSDYLRFGDYYVKEVIAPNGYVLNDTKYPVTISENEQKIEVTGVDERVRGTINIEKQDSITGNTAQGEATLVGAKYGLYARENILDPADQSIIYHAGELVSELTIDEQHKASVSDLYLGKYYLKEIEASEGYTLDETEYDVTLSYQGQTTATVTVNQTVKERVKAQAFQLIKVSDNDSGETDQLEGVEFTIKAQKDIDQYGSWEKAPIAKNAEGEEASILVTDEKGYAVSDELPYGTYIVRETKAPDDHYAIPDFTVVINEDSRDPQPWRVFNDEKFRAVIEMMKLDAETGKTVQIEGATFKIRDLSTNEYVGYWSWNPLPTYITEWTTTADGTVMTGDVLDPGEYQIEEIKAPNGYVLNEEPVKFKVSSNTAYETLPDGSTPVITVKMNDQAVKGQIQIEKRGEVLVDFKDGQFIYEERGIEGMTANIIASEDILDPSNDGTLLYSAGTVVDTITTGSDGKGLSKELPLGKYEIHEVKAPDGYVINDEVKYVELTYKDQTTPVVFSDLQTYLNDRQKVSVTATKLDADTKEELQGAEISLYANRNVYNYDGEVILQPNDLVATAVTNEKGEAVFNVDLPMDLTPEYAVDPEDDDAFGITYNDEIHYEGDLNSLWYVQETKAPQGYVSGVTVRYLFDTIYTNQEQTVQAFEFEFQNEKSKVEISKTDITGEKELAGAHLQVIDNNNNVIDEWVSDGSSHLIEGLSIGESYKLIETIAPDGYSVAEEIEFTVQDTTDVQRVQMQDDLTHIKVLKVDDNGNALAGNVLAIVDSDGKIVDQWTTTEEAHDIYGLIGGTEYTLRELEATDGYSIAKEITFTVPTTENDVITITMSNKPVEMTFSKTDITGEKELAGATLQVIDKDTGTVVDEWVSTEQSHLIKYLVEGKEYIMREISAPYGYEIAKDITFTAKDGEQITMIDELILTDIQVNKVDSVTKEVIKSKDFAFTIYSDPDCKNAIKTVHANTQEGTATFEDLPYGTYYVKETSAPQGYELSNEIKKVVLNDDTDGIGDVHSFVYYNTLLPSTSSDGNTNLYIYIMIFIGSLGIVSLSLKKRYESKNK